MVTHRAAIVGCGRIGCSFDDDSRRGYVSTHAGAYTSLPQFDLVALCDVDPTRVAAYGDKFEVPGRYTDWKEMLASEQIDVLSVCTTVESHMPITVGAAAAGVRAVFCEKPIAEGLAEADEMIAACRSAGAFLIVDHLRRFDRFHRAVMDYVRGGRLGEVQHVSSYYSGGLANTGTHLCDLLGMLLGKPSWAFGMKSRNHSGITGDDNIDALILFENDVLASLQACDAAKYTIFEVNILGSEGRFRIGSHGFSASYEEALPSTRVPGRSELVASESPIDANGKREFMLQAMTHLAECLDGRAEPWSTGEDGRRALELITALHLSAADGGIRIPMAEAAETRREAAR